MLTTYELTMFEIILIGTLSVMDGSRAHDTVDGAIFSKAPVNQRTIHLNDPQTVKYRSNDIRFVFCTGS